jgi:hypothetical protein
MQRLSSKSTWWYKRGFPTLWFALLALFLVGNSFGTRSSPWTLPMIYLCIGSMALFGYVVLRKGMFLFADGVFEADDGLVVFNRGEARKIAYREIEQLYEKAPSYVVVTFTQEEGVSEELSFMPESTWGEVWRRNRVVEELALKVARAQREVGTDGGDAVGPATSSTQRSLSEARDSCSTTA